MIWKHFFKIILTEFKIASLQHLKNNTKKIINYQNMGCYDELIRFVLTSEFILSIKMCFLMKYSNKI